MDDDKGTQSGSAYVFSESSPGNWIEVKKLVASDGDPGDEVSAMCAGLRVIVASQSRSVCCVFLVSSLCLFILEQYVLVYSIWCCL